MKDSTQDFLNKHHIKIIDTNKRAHRITRMNTRYFTDSEDYNKVMFDALPLETETLFTVEICESELKKIADFESEVFNHMRQTGHYNMFEIVMEQKEREKYLRDRYPAVKKAYEHYSLMLKMAEAGEL